MHIAVPVEDATCPECDKTNSEKLNSTIMDDYPHLFNNKEFNQIVWQRRQCRLCQFVFVKIIHKNM